MLRTSIYLLLSGLLQFLFAPTSQAQSPQPTKKPTVQKAAPTQFIRLQRDEKKQPVALETAIVRYVPASGKGDLEVDLVGAVHIGDKDYYKKLNKQFQQYDVVLYELVAQPGTVIPKGGQKKNDLLSFVMQIVKFGLDLELQTERIDYTKKNFVHADLSPEQMAEAIQKRGDDPVTLLLGFTADMLRQMNAREQAEKNQPQPKGTPPVANAPGFDSDLDVVSLILDPETPKKLKRMLAEQLANIESPTSGLGPTLNNILIADRNEAAMKVFQKELAQGKKKIAIFYGAGHMPDFEKRLRLDFGLEKKSVQWLEA
ncbi:MAG TPA: hypothetical protein VGX70_16875, partial [Gemmataceae bacterium]|nr:hypothetical protein [Gemmataceae bacterium]